jgi:hypothetical protein
MMILQEEVEIAPAAEPKPNPRPLAFTGNSSLPYKNIIVK